MTKVVAHNPATPSVMKDRAYAIIFSSELYTSLFTCRYICTLFSQALAFIASPSNADSCPSFNLTGLRLAAMVAALEVDGWLLMGCCCVGGCVCCCVCCVRGCVHCCVCCVGGVRYKNSRASMRSSMSVSSSELSYSEVVSGSVVSGVEDEKLGIGIAPSGLSVSRNLFFCYASTNGLLRETF